MTPMHRLMTVLDKQKVAYHVPASGLGLTVQGDVDLSHAGLDELPSGLNILGFLSLSHSPITQLPDQLSVQSTLYAGYSRITALPPDIFIGQGIDLSHTPLASLPDGLRVHHSLSLVHAPIEVLPEGLSVDGYLNLQGTSVRSFPRSMRVSGFIHAPPDLADLHSFMEKNPDGAVFEPHGSHHQRMQLRERLSGYPDLLQVVMSVYPGFRLHILRDGDGKIEARLRRVDS